MARVTKNAAKVTKATTKSKVEAKATTKAPAKAAPQKTEDVYRQGGGYWSSVKALRELGVGKMHSFEKIIPAVIRAMGAEAYKAFKSKDARNENGKDASGRIIQNVSVVARKDYGLPLKAVGYEVRFDGREKAAGLFKLGK